MTSGKLFGLFLLLAVALIVMACTTPEESSCDTAWAKAAAISDLRDTVEDLDPAIRACTSLQEWESAAAKYPEALDGVDPVLFLSNRCFYGSRLVTLCQWLIAHPDSIDPGSILAFATMASAVLSQPTTAPVSSATPDPLIAEIEAYFSAIEQFVTLHPEISEDIWGDVSRYDFVGVSADWRTELSELLNQDVQLHEEWVDIDPPEPLRGFHETFARGLAISVELRNLFTEWMDTFAAGPADAQPPWERVAAFTSDRQRVLTNSLEALAYGNAVYAELTGGEELNFTIATVFGIADRGVERAEEGDDDSRPTPTIRTAATAVLGRSGEAARDACTFGESELVRLESGIYRDDPIGFILVMEETRDRAETAWRDLSGAAKNLAVTSGRSDSDRFGQFVLRFRTLCTGYRNTGWVQ